MQLGRNEGTSLGLFPLHRNGGSNGSSCAGLSPTGPSQLLRQRLQAPPIRWLTPPIGWLWLHMQVPLFMASALAGCQELCLVLPQW